jgi:hypothetical protein
MERTIDGTPSVQMPTQFSQDRPFVSRYEDKTLNISCDMLVSGSSLQQKSLLEFHNHLQISQMLQHNFYW